jgi:hypothetical protein
MDLRCGNGRSDALHIDLLYIRYICTDTHTHINTHTHPFTRKKTLFMDLRCGNGRSDALLIDLLLIEHIQITHSLRQRRQKIIRYAHAVGICA